MVLAAASRETVVERVDGREEQASSAGRTRERRVGREKRNWSKVEVTTFEEQTKLPPMEEVIRGLYESFISALFFATAHS